ncbi:S9 family peptidase [Cellulomonas sp. NPDC089187]|uniref:S9 family peptidase n=1 Tax=Cellulomonas sp. NPDC089187 TaxID=3154970 RepID=UPI00341B1AEB
MIPADLALLHTPGTPTISPDGRWVVVARTAPDLEADEYVGHLWRMPADGSADAAPLTRGHHDTAPQFSPDGQWVAFLRAESQGRPQLFLVEATGGEPIQLTDAPLGVSAPRFSPDGRSIAYLARVPEEGRYLPDGNPAADPPRLLTTYTYRHDGVGFTVDKKPQLFVLDLPAEPGVGDRPAPRQITAGLQVDAHTWLADSAHVAVVAARHSAADEDLRADISAVDVRPDHDHALRPLTDADQGSTLAVAAAVEAADGSGLWLLAQDMGPGGRDFVAAQTGLFHLPLQDGAHGPQATGAPTRLTDSEEVDLDPGTLAATEQGVLVGQLDRGTVRLREIRPDGSARDLLTGLVAHGAQVARGVVVTSAAGPETSGEVHALELSTGMGRRLTDWSAPLRATGRVRMPHELTGSAPDGYPVHGWVVTPDPERFGAGPHPTILMIHGGPYAQYTVGLFDEVQTLAEAGYAVVYGNPRGAAGYGRAHGRSIRQAFGTVDAVDVLALLDLALADPALDGERVGVMGGSYGGYMTAWLTTQTDRFQAAIVERGFLDPISFVGSSDIGWFFGLEYLGDGDTEADRAAVAAQSPMAQVHRVVTPTLVIHSEQDWRCPVEQGQRWFVELKRRGVPTELLLFPGEGHELTRSGRPQHRKVRFDHVLRWWAEHLPV